MPTEYDNTNCGALFKNETKSSGTSPDYKGNLNVNGKDYWLSAWINQSKAGKSYMSIKAKEQDKNGEVSEPSGTEPNQKQEKDIPF